MLPEDYFEQTPTLETIRAKHAQWLKNFEMVPIQKEDGTIVEGGWILGNYNENEAMSVRMREINILLKIIDDLQSKLDKQ